MALTPGHRRLILVDQAGNIFVQDLATGVVVHKIPAPGNFKMVSSQTYSGVPAIDPADGLVALDNDGTVMIVDVNSGRTIARNVATGALFVSYARSRLLIQGSDGTLYVWDARGATLQRVIPGDESYSPFLPIPDPTGHLVARQRSDGTVVLVDLTSGTTLATIPSPVPPSDGLKLGLTFSPDGRHLLSIVQSLASNNSEIIDRDFSTGTLIQSACTTAGRSLTPTEWRSYIGGTPPSNLSCR
jgi:WD40 repeat protein